MALNQLAERADVAGSSLIGRTSVTDRMKNEREQLRSRIDDLDKAIAALEANPELQQILDVVQRAY